MGRRRLWMAPKLLFSIYRFKSKVGGEDRYKIQVIVGYAVPLLFVILTGIVEGAAPRCSYYKPRFLDESCFFAGKVPILILRRPQNFAK